MIYQPAIIAQEAYHLSIAIAPILTGQRDDGLGQTRFIMGRLALIALCRMRLAQHPTDMVFGKAQRRTAVLHGLPLALWA